MKKPRSKPWSPHFDGDITIIEIHTPEEIDAEVKRLRPETARLIEQRMVRVWCLEEDLRTLAYNRLSERKMGGA